MPLVSIIVPVYNVEAYLDRCIKSIICQTYQNIEIILVNDGSIDSSLSICYDWQQKDSRIIVIDKENKGVASARNVGIEKAQGAYVTFIDSDDWIENDMIELMVQNIFKYSADVSVCTMVRKNKISMNDFEIMDNQDAIKKVLLRKFSAVWPQLFKLDLVKRNRFREDLLINEDIIFLLDVYKDAKKIVYDLSKGMYHYNTEERASLTSQKKLSHIISQIKGIEEVNKHFDNSQYKRYVDIYNFYGYYNCLADLIKINRINTKEFNNCYINLKKNMSIKLLAEKNIKNSAKIKAIFLYFSPRIFKLFWWLLK